MAVCRLWILCGVGLLAVKCRSAMYIRDCSDEKRTVIEETNVTFICGPYQNSIEWSYFNNWPSYSIGFCYHTACTLYSGVSIPVKLASFTTSLSWNFESQLDIGVVTRQKAHTYHCYSTQSWETADCGLRVIAPAIIIAENCSVGISNWQIYGTCAVDKMYASDNVYNCMWRKNNNKLQEGFRELIAYNSLDNRTYRRGVCSFREKMRVDQGNYTYSMDVDPGSRNLFYKTINIVPPGEPNHNCPETVFEGSNVSCKCTSSNKGNPSAEFVWDGTATETLFLQDIRPENTAINFSCRLIWGPSGSINRTTVYTLRIEGDGKEKNTALADKGGIIGGVVAAVITIAVIGIVIAVYIVKRRRGSGYMNVTEVPTDSGLGVYHVIPWVVTPTPTKPDRVDYHKAVISEEKYHALQFEEDRTGQEDKAATYHHLQKE